MNGPEPAKAGTIKPEQAEEQHKTAPRCALILGGRGLLGQSLRGELLARGYEVRTLEREDLSLSNPEILTARISELAPDVIFNTVAWTQVDDAETKPEEAMCVNRCLPSVLGRMVRNNSVRLVHFSTDFVFNGEKGEPYTEEDPTDPQCVYGRTKLAGEQALLELNLPNCVIVRTAWLFGPGKKNFVSTMLTLSETRERLTVVHDQVGSPTYTPDLAEAAVNLAECGASGVVHVVNGGNASWCELAAEAVRLANRSTVVSAISSAEWPQAAKRPAFSALNTARYTQLTGKTLRPWVQALREYVFSGLNGEPKPPKA